MKSTHATLVLILSLLLGLQPLASDLYLPTLPSLTAELGASMGQAQLTLTAMLLAFGLSQLVWGPLSDRFGRKPVLLLGTAGYTIAAIGCAGAASIESLILWRVVLGVSMAATVMCARAIVRDCFEPAEGARVMSLALSGLGVIACASAPTGGLVSDWLGWRYSLAVLGVAGSVTLALVAMRFTESLPLPRRQALSLLAPLRNIAAISRDRTFWAYALLTSFTYGGLFTFLAASSFVFIKLLGLSKTQYGLTMFSMSAVYILGTFVCRWAIARWGVKDAIRAAAWLNLLSGLSMVGLHLAGVHTLWAIMGPFYLFIAAHGIHQPCGQSGCVAPFPTMAGTASAFNGALMMLCAFAMGTVLGLTLKVGEGASAAPLVYGTAFWGALTAWVAMTLVQRHGDLSTPAQRQAARP